MHEVQASALGCHQPRTTIEAMPPHCAPLHYAWQVKLSRGMAAPGAQGMTRSAVPQVAKRQKGQLDNIAELARLRVITEAQANDMRTGALLKQEDYTVQLLAMNELVQQGHLTRQHFDAAVQLVLQKIHS